MVASPYRSLAETSSRLSDMDFVDGVDANCIDDANTLLERITPILDSARCTLRQRCEVPVEYRPDFVSYHVDDVQHLRNLSRAFRFASDVAAYNKDFTSVAQFGGDVLELANSVRRGGLIVDHLVSVAISGVGISCLRSARDRYDDNVRRDLIARLCRQDDEREPFAEIVRRDAKWESQCGCESDGSDLCEDALIDPNSELSVVDQKALLQLIQEVASRPRSELLPLYEEQEKRAMAFSRLLSIDLALRCWYRIANRYPSSLTELSLDVLQEIPHDPFTGDQFIYRTTDGSFMLYSTGPDQTDCGGRFGSWPDVSHGGFDLCLDADDFVE